MRIAFAGNPNSGKTTMYNVITGENECVGNWGGVTVGKKEAPFDEEFTGGKELIAVDLPGAYSMSPFTPEESITSEFVRDEHPDAIINIVDATNLSRSLFFTTQLLELGIPVIVALNKSDINEKEGTTIDVDALSAKLNCPVIKTVSTDKKDSGVKAVVEAAAALEGKGQKAPYLQADIDLHDKNAVDAEDRKRFAFVNDIVKAVETRKIASSETTKADKLDNVLTNPIAGIIIFAAVMWCVFAISQTYLGTWIADWLVGWIEAFQGFVEGAMENSPALLSTIIGSGIIGGVGAVVGFLPLIMVMFFLIALLAFSCLDGLRAAYGRGTGTKRHAFSNPLTMLASLALIFGNAVLSFYEIELINNYYIARMEPKYVWLNVWITFVLYLVIVFLTNSLPTGMRIGNVFFLCWGIANYFVQSFRGSPFQWVDLYSIRTASNVAGNYRYNPNWEVVACTVLTFAVFGFYPFVPSIVFQFSKIARTAQAYSIPWFRENSP